MRNNLRKARLNKNLTHARLANQVGIVRTSYTNIERGIRNPSKKVQLRIRKVLENENDNLFINE